MAAGSFQSSVMISYMSPKAPAKRGHIVAVYGPNDYGEFRSISFNQNDAHWNAKFERKRNAKKEKKYICASLVGNVSSTDFSLLRASPIQSDIPREFFLHRHRAATSCISYLTSLLFVQAILE